MSVPCEVAVKCVLPVVRAMMAKELMAKYQLKQMNAASLLGVSQPAISLYYRNIRGRAIDLENDSDVKKLVGDVAGSVVRGGLSRRELTKAYCEICRTIRAKGLLCKLHKAFDPSIDIESCELCTIANSAKCI
jgi:predicted transcriptional regulator